MSLKTAPSSAAALLLGALATLALTACQSAATSADDSPAHRGSAAASADDSPAHRGGAAAAGSRTTTTTTTTDAYAYKHPCAAGRLSVRVTRRAGAATQWVIAVRNTGAAACGLSHYPRVYLDDSRAADGSQAVRPLVPGTVGGAPAYPVAAARTAYAVIDLDPTGATTGTVTGVDELNVLPDGDHMPAADTRNFPLAEDSLVRGPKLGLYRATVADAAASMRTADTQL